MYASGSAMIVSDQFGVVREERFKSLGEARKAWRKLPMRYASVLFSWEGSSWRIVRTYGLPHAVAHIVHVQMRPTGPPPETSAVVRGEAVEVTVKTKDGTWRCVSRIERLAAVGRVLAPGLDAERLHDLVEDKAVDLGDVPEKVLAKAAANAPERATLWVDAENRLAHFRKKEVVCWRDIDVEIVRWVLLGGGDAWTSVDSIDQSEYATTVSSRPHGCEMTCAAVKISKFRQLHKQLASADRRSAKMLLPSFPRRWTLHPEDRNLKLSAYAGAVVAALPQLEVAAQLLVAEWFKNLARDSSVFVSGPMTTTPRALSARKASSAAAMERLSTGYDNVGKFLDSLPAARQVPELEGRVLVFRLTEVVGLTESWFGRPESRARVFVTLRVADEEEDEVVAADSDDDDDDDEGFVMKSGERAGTFSPRWDPACRFELALAGPDWVRTKIVVAVHDAENGGDDDDSILAYAVVPDLASLAGPLVPEVAVPPPENDDDVTPKNDHLRQFFAEDTFADDSPFQTLSLPLYDEDGGLTEATLKAQAWVAKSSEARALDNLRRHVVVVYEKRVYRTYLDMFLNNFALCATCDPVLFTADHHVQSPPRRQTSAITTNSDWVRVGAVVPADVGRPYVLEPPRFDQSPGGHPSAAARFEDLSPLRKGEVQISPWEIRPTPSDDPMGYSYATTLASKFWFNAPSPATIYRRIAYFRHSSVLASSSQ